MTDDYETRVIELAAETEYILKDPYGTVLPEEMRMKFDLMKELAAECKIASDIRKQKIEFSTDLISWIKEELYERFITRIAEATYNKYPEKTFLNIVFCVVERLGMRAKGDHRERVISYSTFCELIGKNRKTLSSKCTPHFKVEKIKKTWLLETDIPININLRKAIIDIFNDFARKYK